MSEARIIVGISFRSEWLALCETVATLAKALDASVRLVHASEGDPATEETRWSETITAWFHDREVTAQFIQSEDDPVKSLLNESSHPDAALLALGASDVRSRAPGYMGRNTVKLLRGSAIPVLVVPWASRLPRGEGNWHVLYPTDFSDLAALTL